MDIINYKEERRGSKEYYEMAIIQYCNEKRVSKDTVERKPSRPLSTDELGAIVSVFNNENTLATLQSCLDCVDGIMAIISRGISIENIYLKANPYSNFDKCLAYIDPNYMKKEQMA